MLAKGIKAIARVITAPLAFATACFCAAASVAVGAANAFGTHIIKTATGISTVNPNNTLDAAADWLSKTKSRLFRFSFSPFTKPLEAITEVAGRATTTHHSTIAGMQQETTLSQNPTASNTVTNSASSTFSQPIKILAANKLVPGGNQQAPNP